MSYHVVNVTDVHLLNCSSSANVVCLNVCLCQEPEAGITVGAGVIVPLVVAGILIIAVLVYAKFQSHRFREYDAYTAEKLEFGSGAIYRRGSIRFIEEESNRYLNEHSTQINRGNGSGNLAYQNESNSNGGGAFSVVNHVVEENSVTEAQIDDERRTTSNTTESKQLADTKSGGDTSKSTTPAAVGQNPARTSNVVSATKKDQEILSTEKDKTGTK